VTDFALAVRRWARTADAARGPRRSAVVGAVRERSAVSRKWSSM